MNRIGILTYDIPHRKTYDTLCLLKAKGYNDVSVFAKQLHYKKHYNSIYSHRPNEIYGIHPKDICENFNYRYTLEEVSESTIKLGSIILICGAGLIENSLIKNYKIINSHPGYIPNSRGLDSYKWAIYENQPIGVTTHILGEYIDAGLVIERKLIDVYKTDTFHSVAQRIYEFEIKMLVEAIEKINGDLTFIEPQNYLIHKRMPADIEKNILSFFENYKYKVGE